MLVPAVGVRELLWCWLRLKGLEGLDVGLGRAVAGALSAHVRRELSLRLYSRANAKEKSEVQQVLWVYSYAGS